MEDMLPESVLIDVISRLPVKTITCCKCVCKRWRGIVSDPYFVRLHLSRSSRDQEALMILDLSDVSFSKVNPGTLKWLDIKHDSTIIKSLNLKHCEPPISVSSLLFPVGSVNGLVSYCTPASGDYIYVFNPVLEEYITLPPLPLPPRGGNNLLKTLGYGFGVSTAGEYKVIWITIRRKVSSENAVQIKVHTLGTDNGWRQTPPNNLNLVWLQDPCVHLNSHLCWLGAHGQIFDFDLSTETSELFPYPPGDYQEPDRMLGVLKGRLSCICWCSSRGVEVWVRKEESANWYKEITLIKSVIQLAGSWRPLCLIDGLEGISVLLTSVRFVLEENLVVYCLNTNKILSGTPISCSLMYSLTTYRPSFVKLDSFGLKRVHAMHNHNSQEKGTLPSLFLISSANRHPTNKTLVFFLRSMEDRLPENLTIDIFSRLPIKSIISCKCVCKKWRSLVADPYFARLHLAKSRQEALMILQCPDLLDSNANPRATLKWAEIDEHEHLDTIKSLDLKHCEPPLIAAFSSLLFPIGTVNGLVSYLGDRNDSIFIFNPLLEEYIIVPTPPPEVTMITLAYGFGVSTATGEYKVIRINLRVMGRAIEIEAHTVGTDEWRSLRPAHNTPNLVCIKGDALCLDSHLYWEADRCQILDFDLNSETSELLPAPGDNQNAHRTFGVIKGRLSCICWSSTGRWEGGVEVWVRKEGNNNWYKEMNVASFYFSELWPWRPLCLIDDLEQGGTSVVLLVYVRVAEADKLVAYCLNTNRILSETTTLWSNCSSMVTYRPSFVKLDRFGLERVHAMYNHSNSQGGDLRKECSLACLKRGHSCKLTSDKQTLVLFLRSMEDKLPEYLTIEIFSRLPIKSVISCKCVCKKWRSLVADPYFARLHLAKSRQEALMILQCPDLLHPNVNPTTFLKWAEIDEHQHLEIIRSLNLKQCEAPPIAVCSLLFPIGSVNGLVSYTGDKNDSIFIFNPLLEEYIILPAPPPEVSVITLAYGFGVSTATGEYKVIRINLRMVFTNPSQTGDWAVGIEAHTVGTDEWRSLRQTTPNLGWLKGYALCLNSHLYWEADRCQIYDFDLNSETSELFPAPGDNRDANRTLGVIKGRLSCVCWSSTGRWEGGVEVWVRKEGNNNWYKEMNVASFYFSELWPWRPLCLIDDLEQGTSVLLLYVQVAEAEADNKLVAYCLNTKKILSETPTLWSNCSSIVTYRPSFVKLDRFGFRESACHVQPQQLTGRLEERMLTCLLGMKKTWRKDCLLTLEV
ncbi:hypothetical protein SSX86_005697 [Deinandra increscens subsp. villosa]|uniref:F-box domain-containing protein n=1 Tax=Deinandra increscens subsp. villosa TaxID=3103831 RepID=A0AAP0DQD9_9ASTR